jgi:hypothetical protein
MTELEVTTWPGVYAATRTFAGWVLMADARHPEETVASARKLAETTGCTVTVTQLIVTP